MKRIYAILFVIALLVILYSLFCAAYITHLPINVLLFHHSDDWSLFFHSPNHKLLGRPEDYGKLELLQFLSENRVGDRESVLLSTCLPCMVSLSSGR
jgi:hypothetical protein